MRILFAASEVAGFAKTGGLADVASSLPKALTGLGIDCAVVMPLYGSVRRNVANLEATPQALEIFLAGKPISGRVWRSSLPGTSIPVYLIEQRELFERDDANGNAGLYQYRLPSGQRVDYADNSARFGFFSQAVLDVATVFQPDVLHLNDWQTGLVPIYLHEVDGETDRRELKHLRSVFTIHNLAYQGLFPAADMAQLGLPAELFNFEQLEFYGQVSFLKAGLIFSDLLTTVSPTYAREIQTPYFGCGLQGVLMRRSRQLVGIVNGIDEHIWDPAHDRFLTSNYTADTLAEGKARCKSSLQKRLGLTNDPKMPLLGMVTRLAEQKGVDLLLQAAPSFLKRPAQLVILGEGDASHQGLLMDLERKHPKQVGVRFVHDEALAHQIEAGCDMFLMPSRYEPCGLNQLYSLKYGTVPIVRATGGLADTVVDATTEALRTGKASGFSFLLLTPAALTECVNRALTLYLDEPKTWHELQRTGMSQDWSWSRSAREYAKLYDSLL